MQWHMDGFYRIGQPKLFKNVNRELKRENGLLKSQASFGNMGIKKGLFTDAL
jgi:hypothetical protein